MQFLHDLKYSLRLLRAAPGFTAITLVVIVLGLSLFMTSYTFGRLLTNKPLPFPNGESFIALKTVDTRSNTDMPFLHDLFTLDHIRNNTESYALLGGFSSSFYSMNDGESAQQFSGASISVELFASTSTAPLLGRNFDGNDTVPGAVKVGIIGYTPWQEFYGGDPDVIGKTVEINGQSTTIVGVMPEDFHFPSNDNLWLPISQSAAVQPGDGGPHILAGVLKQGSTLLAAEAELNAAMAQLYEEYPEYYSNRYELVLPFVAMADPTRPISAATAIMITTLIVLALSIVNLASLLFIRSSSREHELAVRTSVGSTGWQLSKQVLLESFVICAIGFALSLLVSTVLLYMWGQVMTSRPTPLPFWIVFVLDWNAIAMGLLCTLVVWLVSGLIVAIKASRGLPGEILQGTSTKSSRRKKKAVASSLIVGVEVILSCFLLVFCGFVVRGMMNAIDPDFGIETANYVVGKFSFSGADYTSPESRLAYIDELTRSISATTGINAAVVTTAPVGIFGIATPYNLQDRDLASSDRLPILTSVWITADYFSAIDIEPLQGRDFDRGDVSDGESVVLINDGFAQQLWPQQSAIGKRILLSEGDQQQAFTVVGVMPTVLQSSSEPNSPTTVIYRPVTQGSPDDLYLLASHQGQLSSADLERYIITAASAVNRDIPIREIRSLDSEIDTRSGGIGVILNIFATFSLATLLLAAIGIYGVLARNITLRTGEIGIRRALGSPDAEVISQFLKQGFYFLSVGALVGGGSACLAIVTAASTGIVKNGISFLPLLCVLVAGVMAAVIFLASYIPARRAVGMEPGDALRYE